MVVLNKTENPISRKERVKLNQNWDMIEQAFSDLQVQINILAGGKEVDELLQSIEDAIQRADELIVQMNDAIVDVNEAIVETNTAKDEAIEATNNANQAIENVNRAFEQVNQLTTEVEGLITQLNEKLAEAQANIEEGTQLNQSLTVLQTSLTQLQTDLQSALAESLAATQNANTAYEAIKGWTGATEWQADTTYAKNNVVTHNGSTFQSKIDDNVGNMPTVTDANWIILAQRGVDGEGSVSSVNGISPDPSGNVEIPVVSTWDDISGKPSTFTPGTHKHVISDVDGLQDALDNVAIDDTKYVFTDGSKTMNSITIGSRKSDSSVGVNSFTQGLEVTASGAYSHAEGYSTKAIGRQSHAEGSYTIAEGDSAHAEGTYSVANGDFSHAKGYCSYAGLGTLYTVDRTDNNLKTITLDSVDGLLVGDKLDLKSYGNGEYTLLNVPITAIEGNVVTVDTTEYISAKYAIKRNANQSYESTGVYAEGNDTISIGAYSHAEGSRTIASGNGSHAEGSRTIASGNSSHAEGSQTIASGNISHAEGGNTIASGIASHAEGLATKADGKYSHAEGSFTSANGESSHAEGSNNTANGEGSHVEGSKNVAFGIASHAEGYSNGVGTSYSHAKGRYNLASNGVVYDLYRITRTGNKLNLNGTTVLTVGAKVDISRNNDTPLLDVTITEVTNNTNNTTTITLDTTESLTSVKYVVLRNEQSEQKPTYVEGESNTASGNNSHSEGRLTHASGEASHSEGISTIASGKCSHAGGQGTEAKNLASTAIGQYSKMSLTNATEYDATADAFVIGNGTSSSSRSNAFRVAFDGSTYGLSAFNSIGADYAEYFEWLDGNVDDEERIGFVVTLEGDKIRKANENDLYILGIISANPSVIGDSYQDDWQGKYVTDEWGRIQYHWVDVEHEEPQPPIFNEQTGEYEEQEPKKVTRKEYHPILNENWSNEMEYTPREQRPEWDAVGLVGKLYVRDDGTCQVNNFAKVGAIEGVLTHSDEMTNMRVMERVAPNIVRVFIK